MSEKTRYSDLKNKVAKKETGGTVNEVCFKDIFDVKTSKVVAENIPVGKSHNIPLALLGQCNGNSCNERMPHRRYTKAKCIEILAITKCKQNGRGISFLDLLSNSLASHKQQAQATLKYCLRSNILFTPYDRKPQQYYPTCLKSEISNKIIPVGAIGVRLPRNSLFQGEVPDNDLLDSSPGLHQTIVQTLEGYVLPLLPKVPLHIHKMHFKVRVLPECYQEIVLPASPWNKGKEHEEIIGRAHARYRFYANGTVVISTESSQNPFRLENESDCSSLMAFLGQLRDRLVLFLADKHERMVPDIMDWELTQCDINKDVRIENWLQLTGLSIQVRHVCHLFRVYIKSRGKDTVCRVEESISSKNKSVVEAINEIFNPTERLEKQIAGLSKKLDRLVMSSSNNISSTINVAADCNGSRIIDRRWSIN
jgi:hypothetical protein